MGMHNTGPVTFDHHMTVIIEYILSKLYINAIWNKTPPLQKKKEKDLNFLLVGWHNNCFIIFLIFQFKVQKLGEWDLSYVYLNVPIKKRLICFQYSVYVNKSITFCSNIE